jgi:FKBP-type peptidyl-prolyl cis-trans isomerase 2
MLICLLNVDFKFFPKLLIDRLTPMADNLISKNQTAFIKGGGSILEGVVTLHEILHEFKWSGEKGVLFKIDFEKAYGKVKWDFVQEVLKKGFPPKWIMQIMCIVQGGVHKHQ